MTRDNWGVTNDLDMCSVKNIYQISMPKFKLIFSFTCIKRSDSGTQTQLTRDTMQCQRNGA